MKIPTRVSSRLLQKHFRPGEPSVLLKACNVGSNAAYEFTDRNGRAFIMSWEAKYAGHIIRIPLSVWMANKARIAHDVMESKIRFPLVVLFELPVTATPPAPVIEEAPRVPKLPDEEPEPESPPANESGESEIDAETLRLSIAEYVKEKPVRIKDLSEQLGVSPEQVKAALADATSTAEVASAGWVRIKTTE